MSTDIDFNILSNKTRKYKVIRQTCSPIAGRL